MNVLVINCGSSSVKFQLLDTDSSKVIEKGNFERLETEKNYREALRSIAEQLRERQVDAVGHRVVHGGEKYATAQNIDASVIEQIEACIPLAPLHNPANLMGIRAAGKAFPDIPQVAVFDTAFHARLPRRARTYALDPQIAEPLKIRRYGFHGPSHAIVAQRAAAWLQRPMEDLRLVTCHLGNGASACAVEFGTSTETSMGMTPLEGLIMGTRCGDIDPAVPLRLVKEGRSTEEVENLLNKQSGLLGLSGISKDVRDIEEQAARGNERARLALAAFGHRVRKYIGAYAVTMGGVDAVVLTGGVGEHSAGVRARILQRLEFLGLFLDHDRNTDCRVDRDSPVSEISTAHSRVRALVVATNEELIIARETAKVVRVLGATPQKTALPIAVHACHAHLSREVFLRLFGEGAELTPARETSQPGQFVAEQKVSIIGPRGRVENACIVGPLCEETQVEIPRSIEFRLGADAPVRPAGRLEDSAPVTLEGPAGRVQLEQGLICARLHIHMTPEDAELYGVRDRDEVAVEIAGGERDLLMEHVQVRVGANYRTEMHMDIDEAGAAGLLGLHEEDFCYFSAAADVKACIRKHTYRA